jgi:N,N'-diacetyllegionaminate synthase
MPLRGATPDRPTPSFRARLRGLVEKQHGGDGCLIVAEVAQNHDGSLGLAHAFVDAVAAAGADAIKFQTHIAAAESTAAEPWRVHFSRQDRTRFDYWRRMELSAEQWKGLHDHARERDLLFLSSPFSIEAVDLLERIGVPAWKVASGEVTNTPLLARIARSRLPVIVSTGMSPIEEVDRIVAWAADERLDLALLQCTSMYPCPPERVGLNLIPFFRSRYATFVGLSDHSGTIYPGLAAAALGADVVEVHVALSKEMFGPDVTSSIDTHDLRRLVEGVRCIERMTASPVDKDEMARELAPLRQIFTKSIVVREDLTAGTVLRADHLTCKKPGGGLSPMRLPQVVGCRLRRDVSADTVLHAHDLEGLE